MGWGALRPHTCPCWPYLLSECPPVNSPLLFQADALSESGHPVPVQLLAHHCDQTGCTELVCPSPTTPLPSHRVPLPYRSSTTPTCLCKPQEPGRCRCCLPRFPGRGAEPGSQGAASKPLINPILAKVKLLYPNSKVAFVRSF